MINASEAREDDEDFQNPVDLMFERLEEKDPEHFAVKQYKKYKLAAGAAFVPKSNRGKYCPDCAGRMKKIRAAERKRKQRQRCHALEPFKPA